MLKIKSTSWDLSPLGNPKDFPNIRKQWESEIDEFVAKWSKNNKYLEDPKILKQALDELEDLDSKQGLTGDEGFYYHLMEELKKDDPKIKAASNKIEEFLIKQINKLQFFDLRLSKISEKKQKEFLASEELKEYRHDLESLFKNAKYLLSEPEEKIMNLKGQTSYSLWVAMVEKFISLEQRELIDENGKKSLRSFQEIMSLTKSKNKKVRDKAAEALNEILLKHVNVAEEEINAIYLNKKINDELRGFSRPDQARHVSDDIDTEVVDTLLKVVSENYDISKKYYKLKAKLLGLPKLQYHERTVDYGEITKEYSYEDSVNLIYKTFSNLDPKFAEIFKQFVENSQIDVYPKKGKHGGAFCTHGLKRHPTYILLNHTNKLDDVLTIAHESGHGINNELIKEKQKSIYFDTPVATAEVASTFMEDFVLKEILKDADDELKLILLMQKLDQEIASIPRQVACYLFEQDLHKALRTSGYLTKEDIGKLFQKHMSAYMGEYVEMSPGSENWWVYWSHIREYFYTYSYASGLLISKAMQKLVCKDPKNIEKVKDFLSTGTSLSPKEIFLKLGIDITKKEFWLSGLEELRATLNETEKLAKKLKKIKN